MDGVGAEVHERVDERLDGGLVSVLGDLDESHDNWANVGAVARLVASGKELHGGVFDLDKSGGTFFGDETFEELDTFIDGLEKAVMITTANFMKFGFLGAGGMEVGELVLDTFLFGTVGLEDAFALGLGSGTGGTLVVGAVTGKGGVGNFVSTESLFLIAVDDLLFLEGVMFALFVVDFSSKVVEHSVDVIDGAASLHHVGDLGEDSLLTEEGWVLELSGLGHS